MIHINLQVLEVLLRDNNKFLSTVLIKLELVTHHNPDILLVMVKLVDNQVVVLFSLEHNILAPVHNKLFIHNNPELELLQDLVQVDFNLV